MANPNAKRSYRSYYLLLFQNSSTASIVSTTGSFACSLAMLLFASELPVLSKVAFETCFFLLLRGSGISNLISTSPSGSCLTSTSSYSYLAISMLI